MLCHGSFFAIIYMVLALARRMNHSYFASVATGIAKSTQMNTSLLSQNTLARFSSMSCKSASVAAHTRIQNGHSPGSSYRHGHCHTYTFTH